MKFVLVTGCPRSGTTAMGLWLGSQEGVRGSTESRRTIAMHAMLRESRRFACFHPPFYAGTRTTDPDVAAAAAGKATLHMYGAKAEDLMVVDKEPLEPVALPHEDYVGYLTDVRAALDARLLCMLRNPVDAVSSMSKRRWGVSLHGGGETKVLGLSECVEIWKKANRAMLRMSVLEPEATRLQCHEDLCADPARETEAVGRWLGLGQPLTPFPLRPRKRYDLKETVLAETVWERRLLTCYDERPPSEPAICLLTGEPGVGKTTIATQVARTMDAQGWRVVVLDGDELRQRLWPDLTYDPLGRSLSVRRTMTLALTVARAGAVVVVAMVAPHEAERRAAEKTAACDGVPFHVVRMAASREDRVRRRPEDVHHVGYEEPVAPAMTLDTSKMLPSEATSAVLRLLDDRRR